MDSLTTNAQGAVLTVTIDRPERLNAINSDVLSNLDSIISDIRSRSDIRAVIITGSGERAFASGADIGEFDDLHGSTGYDFTRRGQQVMTRWEELSIPTIAVIDGWALGGGCELALACTLRLASNRARLGLPEITLGVMPGYGGTQRLPRLIGEGLAMEMILTGEPVDAERAYQIGLVNHVFAHEELSEQAASLAERLANRPKLAVQYVMESVRAAAQLPIEDGLKLEAAFAGILTGSDDKREGVQAFLEKRRARWSGTRRQ